MNEPPRTSHRSTPAPVFRPAFTLLMLYFFAFFVFFAVLLALPALLEGMRTIPPATTLEAERAAGAEIAKRAVQGKLLYALLAAIVATGIGSYGRILPGVKRPQSP
jgi:hypothetical protein